MEESLRTRIGQIARNAIQEIDRIAQIVHANESSFSSARSDPSSSSTSNEPFSSSTRTGAGSNGEQSTGQSRAVLPSLSRVCDTRDRNALTELRRRFPTLSSSNSAVGRGGSVRRHGNVGRPSRGSAIKDIVIVGAQVEKTPLGRYDKLLLEKKNRVITGFMIEKSWNESVLYDKVKAQFPEDCRNIDYEFVRNVCGTLVKPNLAAGVKIDAKVLLKSIASTGVVYVRLFADDLDDIDDSILSTSPFDIPDRGSGSVGHSSAERTSMEPIYVPNNEVIERSEREGLSGTAGHSSAESMSVEPINVPGNEVINLSESEEEVKIKDISEIVEEIRKDCEHCQNPTEILQCAQNKILTGRQLDITDPTTEIFGDTNFILVDRENLLVTGLDEIASLTNLRLPVEVNFTGEEARDYGGPRKEFFRLMLIEIKEKYFDGGLRTDLAEKYMTVGVVMGLSVLQNGKIPQFIPEEVLNEVVQGPSSSPCIKNFQNGLRKVGILQLVTSLPIFLYLFRPSDTTGLNVKKLTHLLAPTFQEQGSNSRKYQKEVHNAFIRYIREVSAGRRAMGSVNLTLGHILQFVCGTDEEPVLGFAKSPEIRFVPFDEGFLPTANTCINVLNLPCASATVSLPSDDELFNLYDYAFSSSFFGNV